MSGNEMNEHYVRLGGAAGAKAAEIKWVLVSCCLLDPDSKC